ncbi:hypothetical protein FKM82_031243 [Ascaphus truei]
MVHAKVIAPLGIGAHMDKGPHRHVHAGPLPLLGRYETIPHLWRHFILYCEQYKACPGIQMLDHSEIEALGILRGILKHPVQTKAQAVWRELYLDGFRKTLTTV